MAAEPWQIGVDEVGKGSVLGDMVHGAVAAAGDLPLPGRLLRLVVDSKKSTPANRAALYDWMLGSLRVVQRSDGCLSGVLMSEGAPVLAVALAVTSAAAINAGGNLNDVCARATWRAVQAALRLLPESARAGARVRLDRLGSSQDAHLGLLRAAGMDAALLARCTSEIRADDRWPAVQLASCLAKEHRDRRLADQAGPGLNGYPADRPTLALLRQLLASPDDPRNAIVRTKWETVQRLRRELEQPEPAPANPDTPDTPARPVRKRTAEEAFC